MKMRLNFRPRLLPAVVIAATMLLGFKVADIVMNSIGPIAPALAQPSAPVQSPPTDTAKQANAVPQKSPAITGDSAKDPQALSPAEIEVLQQLSQRRTTLDQRASQVEQQEVLLQAAEKRIDEKIAKLQDLQKSIEGGVQKQSAEDDAHLQSLVKIYEAMKPKDAAQIFEQLDMPVLLSVLQRMKELKTSPILAAMDPAKAKAVTTALAQKHDGPTKAKPGTPASNP